MEKLNGSASLGITATRQLAGKAPVTHEGGRRCQVCPTILSRYNSGETCSLHTQAQPLNPYSRNRPRRTATGPQDPVHPLIATLTAEGYDPKTIAGILGLTVNSVTTAAR